MVDAARGLDLPRPRRTALPSGSVVGRRGGQGTEPDVIRHRAEGEDHERPYERGRDGAVDHGHADAAGAEYRGAGRNAGQAIRNTTSRRRAGLAETELRALIIRSP